LGKEINLKIKMNREFAIRTENTSKFLLNYKRNIMEQRDPKTTQNNNL
jgi:hypothetical protein